jgi:hypothetical protein
MIKRPEFSPMSCQLSGFFVFVGIVKTCRAGKTHPAALNESLHLRGAPDARPG